jgi:acyl-coenzyme A thioesterase PaaI-like protein
MTPRTHLGINPHLCGTPTSLSEGVAAVTLKTTPEMAADDQGLVHGGFVFGLADYAAMLAVNDPLVVLGAANTRFLAPVRVGDTVVAHATCTDQKGRKHTVSVSVVAGDTVVFTGEFTTFVLDQHVLSSTHA